MKRDLNLVWQDFVKKAYIKEENIVLKKVEENTAGAVEILVVESTRKASITITEAYCLSNTNILDKHNIDKIHMPKFKLQEILDLLED